MWVKCICNDGFEDALEHGKTYQAVPKGASYLINGKWFGSCKFEVVFTA